MWIRASFPSRRFGQRSWNRSGLPRPQRVYAPCAHRVISKCPPHSIAWHEKDNATFTHFMDCIVSGVPGKNGESPIDGDGKGNLAGKIERSHRTNVDEAVQAASSALCRGIILRSQAHLENLSNWHGGSYRSCSPEGDHHHYDHHCVRGYPPVNSWCCVRRPGL
jgi:hypothetical protein